MDEKLKVSKDTSMLRIVEERLKFEAPEEYEKYIRLDNKAKFEYIEKNRDILNVGYDQKLLVDINAILHPLLEKMITEEEILREIDENYVPKSFKARHNVEELHLILSKYKNNIKTISLEEETRLSLLYYLMIVESLFTADINLLVYLLIKNNAEYHKNKKGTEKKGMKISDLRTINEEKLYKKLIILKENGLTIISNACDRDLRNCIAHGDFIVFENGSVAYENKTNGEVNITKKEELETKIERLLNVCHCINESIKQFGEQKGLIKIQ